jgi:NFU1 iron-sulfur cluster scaffold homolog, mitochondrial
MMIYTEITPNPATLKFVVDKVLLKKGSADFPDAASAGGSAIAQQLYEFAFVAGVFIGHNFISVTKDESKQWEDVIPGVKTMIRNFLETGQDVLKDMPSDVVEAPVDEPETVQRIKKLLDENIRPAVAMDGGDVLFESFEGGTVKLRLQGACSGCPSSTMTLKMGIEGLLTRMVPGVERVESVS